MHTQDGSKNKPKGNVVSTGFITNYWKTKSKDLSYWQNNKVIKGDMTRTTPLFKDNFMEHFASKKVSDQLSKSVDLQAIAEQFDTINPLICPMHSIRHRYFNKSLANEVKKSELPVKQVVILGSGFDTRAVRKSKYSVTYFEVDQPEVLDIKAKIYAKKDISPNAVYIGINYIEQNLINSLTSNGLQLDLPTHFIWEGNIVYLPIEEIKKMIHLIKSSFLGPVTLAFDFLDPKLVNKETGYEDMTQFVDMFSRMGAEFKTGISSIFEFAKDCGIEVIDSHTSSELLNEYGIDNKPDEKLQLYSLCTLRLK